MLLSVLLVIIIVVLGWCVSFFYFKFECIRVGYDMVPNGIVAPALLQSDVLLYSE